MTTATQARVTAEELAELNKPRRDWKFWLGRSASSSGGVHHRLLRSAVLRMVVSSLASHHGSRHLVLANPVSFSLPGGVRSGQQVRTGAAELGDHVADDHRAHWCWASGGYALARLRFRMKGLCSIIIACSMFPGITLLIPLFKMFTGAYPWMPINWMNTYQALIIPSLSFGLPLAVWNLTAFFRQLPVELEQAAMVDGCTPGQAFRKVILPLAAPGVFDRDHHLHRGLERVHDRADLRHTAEHVHRCGFDLEVHRRLWL